MAEQKPDSDWLVDKWKEITDLMIILSGEPYIDDQLEIQEIWDLVADMLKSGKLKDEPWELRRALAEIIIHHDLFDNFGCYDPMEDLLKAIPQSDEEKEAVADMIIDNGYPYLIEKLALPIFRELGREDRIIAFVESTLKYEEKPYLQVIEYYRDRDPQKAMQVAEEGFSRVKDNQTELVLFLLQDAIARGDEEKKQKLLKSAHLRRRINEKKVYETLGLPFPERKVYR